MTEQFPNPLDRVGKVRVRVRVRGRALLYFAGCDYLGLSWHPLLREAVSKGLRKFGLTRSASRKTTGNDAIYEDLESATANFFRAESAVLVSSGYLANFAVAQGLRGACRFALIDEYAHASLKEAVGLSGARGILFRHRDAEDLKRKLSRLRTGPVVIVTDGLFAHGAVAPIARYREIAGAKAMLWVDDAHAGGILGPRGRGSIENAGLSHQNFIQTVTFSKAFGVYGGAVLCDGTFRKKMIAQSSAVSGNTPLPLPLAAATLAALRLVEHNGSFRQRLFGNVGCFWQNCGVQPPDTLTPIIAFSSKRPAATSRTLLRAAIYPPLISYPGGPASNYFRFALSSEHSLEQVTHLAKVVRRCAPDLSLVS